MFDRVGKNEIINAFDELVSCLGIKKEVPSRDLSALLRKHDAEGCVQKIATRLGLPVCINLSYVTEGFSPNNTNNFQSRILVKTDWTGRGVDGIIAQVSIPPNIPMFGTSPLEGYPIEVRVSTNCCKHPDTFIAMMAHELSHVLLATLWSTHKNSELHTDLVPIILGFRNIVRRGRRTVESTTSGNATTTQTTTYGYLTDSQFEFASNRVAGLLHLYSRNKKHLLRIVKRVQRKLKKATRSLSTFRDYFKYIDIHPPEKMSQQHAERIVQLHGQDDSLEWENRITAVRKSVDMAKPFTQQRNHYLPNTVERIKTHTQILKATSHELNQVTKAIVKDVRILRKYIDFLYRLRKIPQRYFSR